MSKIQMCDFCIRDKVTCENGFNYCGVCKQCAPSKYEYDTPELPELSEGKGKSFPVRPSDLGNIERRIHLAWQDNVYNIHEHCVRLSHIISEYPEVTREAFYMVSQRTFRITKHMEALGEELKDIRRELGELKDKIRASDAGIIFNKLGE